jgi:ketosteroid isomerase-like protein
MQLLKKARSRALVLMLASLSAASCAPKATFDADAEGKKLLARDVEWSNLATQGADVEKIVSYWSDDALIIFPGTPTVEGKAAIRDYVTQSLKTPGFKIHWVSEKPQFSQDGTMAWMRGTDDLTVPGPKGQPISMQLRGISVWRKDPDGVWRCVADISNEVPPPPSPTAKAG